MEKNEQKSNKRSPIVVILGHVDHGKTTLLDYIRKTNVQKKEAGGITQGIGASEVVTSEGNKITFIDTPGHAAFSNMRERGAKLADIAILVIASEEGVKPQTQEALEYIIATKIPFVVAATKGDLPSASVDKVKAGLEKLGVQIEGRGGDVPVIRVSGKTGEGVGDLLETVSLISELNGISGDEKENLDASVIETSKEKQGPTASVVIRNGSINIGDVIVTETVEGKVKALFDVNGNCVKSVIPGEAVQILGFSNLPKIGSKVWKKSEKGESLRKETEKKVISTNEGGKLNILVKAKNAGCLEAIVSNLPGDVVVISSGIGDVTDNDIFIAKSSMAKILVFEAGIPNPVKKLAETEGVYIESFNIIYRLFEKVEEFIKKGSVEVLGEAKILATFPFNNKNVAGCKVLSGMITKSDTLILKRGENELGKVKVTSLKRGKDDLNEAKAGEECGILFAPQLDFSLSDMLISVRTHQ